MRVVFEPQQKNIKNTSKYVQICLVSFSCFIEYSQFTNDSIIPSFVLICLLVTNVYCDVLLPKNLSPSITENYLPTISSWSSFSFFQLLSEATWAGLMPMRFCEYPKHDNGSLYKGLLSRLQMGPSLCCLMPGYYHSCLVSLKCSNIACLTQYTAVNIKQI